MCLAIYTPGEVIPAEHLESGFNSNPHGAGFAVAYDNSVHVHKGYFKLSQLREAMEPFQGFPMLVHFRYATHGEVNKFNCHPWLLCGGKLAMIHNGILNIASTEQKSDSGHFADDVLSPLMSKLGKSNPGLLRYVVEQTIGKSNKIAVMDSDGHATIFNEKEGTWDNGIWYSNTGYKRQVHCFTSKGFYWDELCEYCGEILQPRYLRSNPRLDVCEACLSLETTAEPDHKPFLR